MAVLSAAIGDAPFVFVVGKGGVGKSTISAALALEWCDVGNHVHLISTDPAHSLRDLLPEPAPGLLTIEEFAAAAYADAWLERNRTSLTELVEHGTWLDRDDVAGFTRLALPGIDELMAALRLVDLADTGRRVIVDTAPTGHTLRLLAAAATLTGIAAALRNMADKAAVVASSFAGRPMRLRGETLADELRAYARRFDDVVQPPSAFVVAARPGTVIEAETSRLRAALGQRGLRMAAEVWTGAPHPHTASTCLHAPEQADAPRGVAALRSWSRALTPCRAGPRMATPPHETAASPLDASRPPTRPLRASRVATTARADDARAALPWLLRQELRCWLVAGKGGVGKTTCAAALAVALADTRDVLLCSADPAGSLYDVLPDFASVPRLRVQQTDPAAELARLRRHYETQVLAALERIGLSESAVLDRRVIESFWELSPPGLDEIAALVAMLDVARSDEVIVLDAAPTGHFLRLLAMPSLVRDWTHQLMRVLLKYGVTGGAEGVARNLLQLARDLGALQQRLRDPQQTGAVLVSLDEVVVRAEAERLHAQLNSLRVPIAATILNRALLTSGGPDEPRARRITAPAMAPAPVGAAALREFAARWNIVG